LRDERYLESAQRAADFLFKAFTSPQPLASGSLRLLHARKDGATRFNGYLDDYAFFLQALVTLYETDFQAKWVEKAIQVADSLIEQFWDAGTQGFFFTGVDHEALITRPKEQQDGATPAGQSIAVTALLRLARLTGRTDYDDIASSALAQAEPVLRLIPTGMSQMSIALDLLLAPSLELAVIPGKNREEFEDVLEALGSAFLPHRSLAAPAADGHGSTAVKLLEGRTAREGQTTLYVCRNFTCDAPLIGRDAVLAEIEKWTTR
jgi:uncharacterized protein YyaL (SSP411 family)